MTSVDLLNSGSIVSHTIDIDIAIAEARIEEADVDCTLGLNHVACRAEQRHIDGNGIVDHVALLLNYSGDSIEHVLTIYLICLDCRALGHDTLASSHLDDDIAHVGVALKRGTAHIGNDVRFLKLAYFRAILRHYGVDHRGIPGCLLLALVGSRLLGLPRGVIGSRLVRGGNLRGLDGNRQAVVHGVGGNRVRAGLVGGHIGVRTVDGVEHAARLEAVVGSHGELDLGLGREIDRILVLGDRLLGAVRVGVLERRVRDLDRYLRGGILLDRGGVILGRTPPREVILVALGPSGLVGLLVVRGLHVSRGVRGGVRGRIRRIIPLVHRGVGPLGGGPLRGGRLVLGVHRAVLDDLLLSVGRDAELLSDRRDVHGGDGHRCDEHAHQCTLGTHAMLFREVPAFFPKVLP